GRRRGTGGDDLSQGLVLLVLVVREALEQLQERGHGYLAIVQGPLRLGRRRQESKTRLHVTFGTAHLLPDLELAPAPVHQALEPLGLLEREELLGVGVRDQLRD